jgi:endonuclease YncB( thermonuclease family)
VKRRILFRAACILFALALPFSAVAQIETGLVSVRSGVTFRMVGNTIDYRLLGIETCSRDQLAHLAGVAWPCGAVATGWLTQKTLGYEIDCVEEGRAEDLYATMLVRCFLPSGEDIARLALSKGLAWVEYDDGDPVVPEYVPLEEEAKRERRGIWSSNFMLGNQLYRP